MYIVNVRYVQFNRQKNIIFSKLMTSLTMLWLLVKTNLYNTFQHVSKTSTYKKILYFYKYLSGLKFENN